MKKYIFLLTIGIITVLFPLSVNADCQSDFDKIAKDFKVTYEYDKDTDDFSVTFSNPYYERYTYINSTKEELARAIKTVSNGKLLEIFNDYKKTEYHYSIQALYAGCNGVIVKDETIKLVKYNPYADREECKGNEDFILCQKDYDKRIDEETFNSRLEAYLQSKEDTTPSSNSNSTTNNKNNGTTSSKQSLFEAITNYVEDNPIQVGIIVVFIIVLIISAIIFIKKTIKGRRLE